LYTTPFWGYPSQLTLVKLIKQKSTQSVGAEKEREQERNQKKKEENEKTKKLPPKKNGTKKLPSKKKGAGVPCHPGAGFASKV
jgi:hypothetical protein